MALTVTQLESLDIYRDGGSLSVSFTGQETNVQYCLLFPIKSSPADCTSKIYRYWQPVLEVYRTVPYVSPKTGFSNPMTQKENNPISWAEAIALLESIKPHMVGFESDYTWVFEAMRSAAATEGNHVEL